MKYRLTGEEMELLAMHRAKLDANPAKAAWKPDMTNISEPLREMFKERNTAKKQ